MKFLKALWKTIDMMVNAITRNGRESSPVDSDVT